ncbi:hypothetical protein [Lacticaseibacillus yichunensis]|uniref:DUF2092 domain-containing protein n=1 Tax=Lacticaseibacillus yichunensis TaxID=2486015 RepID=A0ABW4CU14_9LACO|nr:hypothetical protein [Lacticaseibacillus yichunensis]
MKRKVRWGRVAVALAVLVFLIGGGGWFVVRGLAHSAGTKQARRVFKSGRQAKIDAPYAVTLAKEMTFLRPDATSAPLAIFISAKNDGRITLTTATPHHASSPATAKDATALLDLAPHAGTVANVVTKTMHVQVDGKRRTIKVNTRLTLKNGTHYFLTRDDKGTIGLVKQDKSTQVVYLQQTNNLALLKQALWGRGFSIGPTRYNGEAINTAMDQDRVPQNTVTDNTRLGVFSDGQHVRVTALGAGSPGWEGTYRLTGKTLTIQFSTGAVASQFRFSYTFQNGRLQLAPLATQDRAGNTLTWRFALDEDGLLATQRPLA